MVSWAVSCGLSWAWAWGRNLTATAFNWGVDRKPAASGLIEIILIHGPCTRLYELVLQLLHFFNQLIQLLFLLFNLFVCHCCHINY